MRDERYPRIGERRFSSRVLATLRRLQPEPTPYTGTDIQGLLDHHLQGKDVTPRQHKYSGMPALLETCDRADSTFWEEVTSLHPDGYLIGIGCGGILSLLQCFPPETPPLGVVMIDINPYVIAGGKAFVEEAKKAGTPEALLEATYYYEQHYAKTLYDSSAETDPLIRKYLKKWQGKAPQPKLPLSHDGILPSLEWRDDKFISIPHIIYQQFARIQEVATTNKFALLHASFSNQDVIQAITSLPYFRQRTNIIYTSNAIDCHTGYSSAIRAFSPLRGYDNADTPPIFVTASRKNRDELTSTRTFSQLRAMYS